MSGPVVIRLSKAQALMKASRARFKVAVCGRRFGKTFWELLEMLEQGVNHPGSTCWYIAPTYKMAKGIAWRDLKALVPEQYVRGKPNETELSMELVNGSLFELRGADDPDRLRGPGLNLAVFDEFAFQHPYVWDVVRPMLSDRGGRAIFGTTPSGFNWAYDFYLRGKQGEDGWESFSFTTLDGGRVPEDELAEARATMDPRMFRQEYEASFETLHGRVYSNFDRDLNVDPSVKDLGGDLLVGMDFNVNPMTAVFASRAVDECHVFDCLRVMTSNTEEVCQEIRRRYPDRPVVVCPDPSGNQRRSSAPVGQTDLTILKRFGFRINVSPAAIPVVDRINNTQAMLLSDDGRRRARIHPRADHLIRGLDGMTYKEGTSIPDKDKVGGFDHPTDAFGYLLWQEFNVLVDRTFRAKEFRLR